MFNAGKLIATQKIPVFSSYSSGASATAGACSWTHTLGSDVTILFVVISASGTTGTNLSTVNGTNATGTGLGKTFGTGSRVLGLHYMLNPPTGSVTISITNATYTGVVITGSSAAYTNGKTVGTGSNASGTSTTDSMSLAGNPNQTIFNCMTFQDQSSNAATGYTKIQRYNAAGSSGVWPIVLGDAPGESSTSFSATIPSSVGWATISIPINAA